MCAHDAVAQKDFFPHLPEIPIEIDEDEETIKIVQLVKSNEPLVSNYVTSSSYICPQTQIDERQQNTTYESHKFRYTHSLTH
jgi:hypothetical protein